MDGSIGEALRNLEFRTARELKRQGSEIRNEEGWMGKFVSAAWSWVTPKQEENYGRPRSSIARKPSSSSTGMPSSEALASFEPGSSPATT